jgi:hypothetical protein
MGPSPCRVNSSAESVCIRLTNNGLLEIVQCNRRIRCKEMLSLQKLRNAKLKSENYYNSFIHSLTHLFIHLFIYLFICLFIYLSLIFLFISGRECSFYLLVVFFLPMYLFCFPCEYKRYPISKEQLLTS